jgi:hypothetical protein
MKVLWLTGSYSHVQVGQTLQQYKEECRNLVYYLVPFDREGRWEGLEG